MGQVWLRVGGIDMLIEIELHHQVSIPYSKDLGQEVWTSQVKPKLTSDIKELILKFPDATYIFLAPFVRGLIEEMLTNKNYNGLVNHLSVTGGQPNTARDFAEQLEAILASRKEEYDTSK